MIRKKINTYKKLDEVIVDIVGSNNKPITANEIHSQLHTQYQLSQISCTDRSIAMRLRGNPSVRVIKQQRQNTYTQKLD